MDDNKIQGLLNQIEQLTRRISDLEEGKNKNNFTGYTDNSKKHNFRDDVTFEKSVTIGKNLVTKGGYLGYAAGIGGTVTQATSKTTAVTLDKPTGRIILNNSSISAGSVNGFTFTNSYISANDIIVFNHIAGGTDCAYLINARCSNGSANVTIRNVSAGALADAVELEYAVIKSANT